MSCYCTYFDSGYLDKGIALIESLEKTSPDSYIYVLAFDDKCYKVLSDIGYNSVRLVKISDFESERMLSIKKNRSKRSYCWTCKPFFIKYVMEQYDEKICTYLDSDLFFFSDPDVVVNEIMESGVYTGIMSHQFGKGKVQERQNDISGKYCAEFLTFTNNIESVKALNWWCDRCEELCTDDTSRSKDGLFGDQMYLNSFPSLFKGVHVFDNQGGGVAPWNIYRYRALDTGNPLKMQDIQTNNEYTLCFYHFHGLKYLKNNKYDIDVYGRYGKPQKTFVVFIYKTYVKITLNIRKMLSEKYNISYELKEKEKKTVLQNIRHLKTYFRRKKDIITIE